jgi:uncharacterized protein (DUF433 family)
VTNSNDLLKQFRALDPDEQERFVFSIWRWLPPWRFFWPTNCGIDKTPGTCGGVARIVRTRIPVWTLEQMRRLNVGESEILRCYPTLRAEDLVNAWHYVGCHEEEINAQIRANEEA